MKQIVSQYATYNLWANSIFIDYVNKLSNEQQQAFAPSSFPSLYKTVVHMWETERNWLKRLKLEENIPAGGGLVTISFEEVAANLLKESTCFIQWIEKATAEKITHVTAYQNSKREQFKQPVFHILMHVFNLETYHRGQMVSMFHQLQLNNIPNTDFITWSRLQKKVTK
ncbi:MAG: hypothetical protein LH478_06075 [Chitinophagaceae bacterium]|nr:hypothetical protein [Chitinophagaceae bacterium]